MRGFMLLWFLTVPTLAQPFLTDQETRVLGEVNFLRGNPQKYAALLEQQRACYRGNLYTRPGRAPIQTQEGVAALDEAIAVLRAQAPLAHLKPVLGLTLAARDHARDQGAGTATGHGGNDGSQPQGRMQRYGDGPRMGENIAYGDGTPQEIVVQLLIDDGVPDRGHRQNLLSPDFQQIGIGLGPHGRYRAMCVMDFAAGYQDTPGLQPPTSSTTRPGPIPNPVPGRSSGPLEQARSVAMAHYQALTADDRAAWMATWSAAQRGTLGQRWQAARMMAPGSEYRYARPEKVTATRMTMLFLRKSVRCPITLILEGSGWKVEEANY